MARDWNDYEAKIREEIERKVAAAQAKAEHRAERARQRAERAAERFKVRANWYADKVKERVEHDAEKAKEGFQRAAERGHHPWGSRANPFGSPFINWMNGGCAGGGKGKHDTEILVGVAILGLGAAMLMANLGLFEFHDIWDFWPMLLVAFGIMKLSRARFASARVLGIFAILAGVVLLLKNLHIVHVSGAMFWPAVLIFIGLQHLLRNFDPPKPEPAPPQQNPFNPFAAGAASPPAPGSPFGAETPTSGPRPVNVPGSGPQFAGAAGPAAGLGTESFRSQSAAPPPPNATIEPEVNLHEYCIFTGGKRRIVTNNFRGGEIVAVFGGVEVDLRAAQIGGDEAVVDITAAFGGCNIKVPLNWYVEMRGVAAFGGYSDKTIPPRLSPGQRIQKLVVTGSAAFGGVVIEN